MWYHRNIFQLVWFQLVKLQISKEIAIWDGSLKYAGKVGVGAGVRKLNTTFKGEFHLEPYLGFHFKLEHLYCFYASQMYFLNPKVVCPPAGGFCSHELQILVKICVTGRNVFKVSLRTNSFCCSNYQWLFLTSISHFR